MLLVSCRQCVLILVSYYWVIEFKSLALTFSPFPAAATSVQISDGGATPTAGQSYTLTCSASGASVTTYQWRKDGTVLSETRPTLSFTPLRLSDAGRYTCEVTADGILLSNSRDITLQS